MSLVWKSQRPAAPGWYWTRCVDGKETIVQVSTSYGGSLLRSPSAGVIVAWAGPIARPKDPRKEHLATVRYQLHGTYLPPRTHYWGACGWDFVDRVDVLRRARARLLGDLHGYNEPIEADSSEVTLYTSRKRNSRWKSERGEKFTAATIDAAIAKCMPAPSPFLAPNIGETATGGAGNFTQGGAMVAREAHNLEIAGSTPAPAPISGDEVPGCEAGQHGGARGAPVSGGVSR